VVIIVINDIEVQVDEACVIGKTVGRQVNKFVVEVVKCIVKIVPFLYKGRCGHCHDTFLLVWVAVIMVDGDVDSSGSWQVRANPGREFA